MNKIFKLSSLFLLATFTLFSCEEADESLHLYEDKDITYFTQATSSQFYVLDAADVQKHTIQVGTTVKSDVDKTINVEIVNSSTAVPGEEFTLESSTVTIPAGEYVADVVIFGDYAQAQQSGRTLTLKLTDGSAQVASFDATHTVTIYQFCPFDRNDFVGTWDVVEDGYDTPYTSEATLGANSNELVFSNLWDVAGSNTVIFDDSDPGNFNIDFPGGEYLYTSSTQGDANIAKGRGTFSACAKTIDMYFTVCVSAGCYSEAHLVLTKQ